jgi:hypothetical protein
MKRTYLSLKENSCHIFGTGLKKSPSISLSKRQKSTQKGSKKRQKIYRHENTPGLNEETSSSCFGGVGRAPPLHIPVKRAKKRPKRVKKAPEIFIGMRTHLD